MSKKLSIGLISLSFIAILGCISPVHAAFDLKRAILFPGNPLYFIKEFSRNVQRTLTVDAVSKAELELTIADSLASEIISVSEKDPAGLALAVQKYADDMDLLKEKIVAIRPEGDEQNAARFLNFLTERSFAHDRMITDISSGYPALDVSLTRNKIMNVLALAENRLDADHDSLPERLESVIADAATPALSVSALDFLELLGDEANIPADRAKDSLVSRIDGIIRSDSLGMATVLDRVSLMRPIDQRAKVTVEIMERTSDLAIKNRLRLSVDKMIKESYSDISAESAMKEIVRAKSGESALSGLAAAFSSNEIMPQVDRLKNDAEDFYNEGNYISAFFAARSAYVIASRNLIDLTTDKNEAVSRMAALKNEYEEVVLVAESRELSAAKAPVLWARFSDVEDILNGTPNAMTVREAEKLISELKILLEKPSAENANERPVFCPTLYDPVCGEDGVTYSNSCVAASAGASVKDKGNCPAGELKREIQSPAL